MITYGTSSSSATSSARSVFPWMDSNGVEYWPMRVRMDLARWRECDGADKREKMYSSMDTRNT